MLDVARDVGMRRHRFKMAIPVCRSEIKIRSFLIRVVSAFNSLPFRVVAVGSIECVKGIMDVILGNKLFDII